MLRQLTSCACLLGIILLSLLSGSVRAQTSGSQALLKDSIGSFLFDASLGNPAPRITVWYYRPDKVEPDTRVVFLMHGSSRTAQEARDVGALFGFLLIVFRRCSNRTLVVLGFSVGVALAAAIAGAKLLLTAAPTGAAALDSPELQVIEARFRAFTGSSHLAAWRENAKFAASYWTAGIVLAGLPAIAGRFLLGYYSGRRRLLHEPEAHLPLFRRLLGWGLGLGLVGNTIWVITTVLTRAGAFAPASPWVIAAQFPIYVGQVAMAGCYLAAILLLSQRPAWRRRLAHLAPVGRMALTNYLAHSFVFVFVFYGLGVGLGLLGRVGTTFCLGLSIVVFVAQIVLSSWWLRRFRFGPTEWAWRWLTYGVRPPMRRAMTTPGNARTHS
jgi:uncharacterized protein